jgi:hypothetical protein
MIMTPDDREALEDTLDLLVGPEASTATKSATDTDRRGGTRRGRKAAREAGFRVQAGQGGALSQDLGSVHGQREES